MKPFKSTSLLKKIKAAAALIFCIFVFTPAVRAEILNSSQIREEVTQYFEASMEGEDIAQGERQNHYFIRFRPEEGFEYILPASRLGDKTTPFYSEGSTLYWYQPGERGPVVPLWIPNRVLSTRNTLEAARQYFKKICEEAGITQRWWKEDEPIQVLFERPDPSDSVLASAAFWKHKINVRPDMNSSFHLTSVAIHEYFHMVSYSVWYDGKESTLNEGFAASREPYRKQITEMTAEWASDEAIQIKGVAGKPDVNQDTLNDYLLERAQYSFLYNETPFLERDQYENNIFIKYLAEQSAKAGGSDKSGADHILETIQKIYVKGKGATRETFFEYIVDGLPENVWPGDAREKWMNFYTAFCASNLVQAARTNENPEQPLGYHDDAFQNLDQMCFFGSNSLYKDMTKLPEKVYSEPAKDEAERMSRMETIMGGEELIEPLAVKYYNIENVSETAPPRPVFVYAKGTLESEVFLIRQKFSKEETSYKRKSAKFRWDPEFNFKDQRDSKEPKALAIYPGFSNEKERQDLWVGLVNPSPLLTSRVINWSYVASPRLIPHLVVQPDSPSKTVRISSGPATYRAHYAGFKNGEEFELEVVSTGPLHREGANLQDIPEEDRSIKLEVLGPGDKPIQLQPKDGKTIKVAMKTPQSEYMSSYTYTFSGKFAEYNGIVGDSRFKFKLTSPLNLGEGDEQIDESFTFKLFAVRPKITEFIVKQGGEIIYENGASRKFPKAEGGSYKFDITVKFSIPMEPLMTKLTAGIKSPYDSYEMKNSRMEKENKYQELSGSIEVPQGDVPKSGAILKFAVSGESLKGGAIDGDLYKEGDQPDTTHFLLLGIEQFYDFEITTTAEEIIRQGDYSTKVDIRPLSFKMRMMPDISDYDGSMNEYMHVFTGRLEYFNKFLAQTDESMSKIDGESSKFGGNKKAQWESEVREKEKRLQGMKKTLTMKNKFPNYPDFEKNMKEAIRVLENDIREQKRAGSGGMKSKDKKLSREKERVQFLKAEFVPRYEALVKLMNAYRKYRYKPDFSGPVSSSFGGFVVQGQPISGWYSENYGDYIGKVGDFEVKTASAEYRGWNTGDISSLAKDPFDENTSPRVYVWEYDPQDLKKARELADMMKNLPPLLKEAVDAGPIQIRGGSQSEILMNTLAQSISAVFMNTDQDIHTVIDVMWKFYPSDQRPKTEDAFDQNGKVKPEALVFPDTQDKTLIRIETPDALPMNIQVEFEGYTFELKHHGNAEPMAWIPHSPGTEKETEERDGNKKEITRTKYVTGATTTGIPAVKELGYTTRADISIKSNMKWGGVTPPPLFFEASNWDLVRYNTGSYFSTSGNAKDVKVTMEGCINKFDVYDSGSFGVEIYGACKSNTMEGTMQAKIHNQIGSETFFYDLNWKTKFVLKKVAAEGGEKVAPSQPAPEPKPEASAPPKPEPAKPERPKQPLPWGQGTNPDTGITTAVQGNEDGSRTVTKTDKDGKVISRETVPPPGERLPSGSSVDSFTGNKIEVQGNADGTRTVTRTNESGKVLSQEILKP